MRNLCATKGILFPPAFFPIALFLTFFLLPFFTSLDKLLGSRAESPRAVGQELQEEVWRDRRPVRPSRFQPRSGAVCLAVARHSEAVLSEGGRQPLWATVNLSPQLPLDQEPFLCRVSTIPVLPCGRLTSCSYLCYILRCDCQIRQVWLLMLTVINTVTVTDENGKHILQLRLFVSL